jgi:hypothetical protein
MKITSNNLIALGLMISDGAGNKNLSLPGEYAEIISGVLLLYKGAEVFDSNEAAQVEELFDFLEGTDGFDFMLMEDDVELVRRALHQTEVRCGRGLPNNVA